MGRKTGLKLQIFVFPYMEVHDENINKDTSQVTTKFLITFHVYMILLMGGGEDLGMCVCKYNQNVDGGEGLGMYVSDQSHTQTTLQHSKRWGESGECSTTFLYLLKICRYNLIG